MNDDFYRAFEDRYRGSREVVKERLQVYLPFIEPLRDRIPGDPALDLGCGRGEWLEVLLEAGFAPTGIDLDEGMLDACHALGLPACKGDAVAHLATLPDDSQLVVSAFHLVEHVHFDDLRLLVSGAFRVLMPGGILIMETPNPESFVVATRHFYLDPTHHRPLPPQLLSFVTDYYGFNRVKIVRLQESKELAERETLTLQDVFQGASPDYAVVAQKNGDRETMALTAAVFEREYGLTPETLLERYNHLVESRIELAWVKAQHAVNRADQAADKAQHAVNRVDQAEDKAQHAVNRADQAEDRAQHAVNRGDQAADKAQHAVNRVDQAEDKANHAVNRADQASDKAQHAVNRVDQAADKVQHAVNRVDQAENKAQHAVNRADQAEDKAQHAVNRAEQAAEKALQALTRVEQIEARASETEARSKEWQEQILALQNSTSWKVTKPLRAIKPMIVRVLSVLRRQ